MGPALRVWMGAGTEYFREVRELIAASGPPDVKAMAAVMLKHGLVPVKPE